MPIYEYECTKCGKKLERRRNIADSDKEIKCLKCGKESPKRVFSVFSTALSDSSCAPSAPIGST